MEGSAEEAVEDATLSEEPTSTNVTEENTKSVLEVSTSSSTFSMPTVDDQNIIDIEKEPLGKKNLFVQPNDTLYSLANAYKTTVDQIMAWNDIM